VTTLAAEALVTFLRAQGLCDLEAVTMAPLSGGQSNPTYVVETASRRMVLRKKPPGALLAAAHAIDREFRVMGALAPTDVPVPEMLAYSEDLSILGTPFYLMGFVEGRVLFDQSLPGMELHERREIYLEMCKVLGAIHAVNLKSSGLETFGKAGNYFSRQVARWSRQCAASTLPLPDALNRLMDWLPSRIPDRQETTLLHGDYRLDNLMFHPSEPRVITVLDWELSTLGDPLADLSYQCMAWHIPPQLWRGVAGLDLTALGIPDEAQYLKLYAQLTGRHVPEHWDFYLAFNLFRMAAILHGIGERAAVGNAAAADAVEMGRKAGPIAEIGWERACRLQERLK
jgi:aminoglycoside phosphotransferase (APT) family kinase protein